jgi:hypothetical protein
MTIKMPSARPPSAEAKADAFISGAGAHKIAPAPAPAPVEAGKKVVNMRLDAALLRQIDRAARKAGTSRTGWLSVKIAEVLKNEYA